MFTFKDEYNLVYDNSFDKFIEDTKGAIEVFDSDGNLTTTTVTNEQELSALFDRYLVENEDGIIAYSCEGNNRVNEKIFASLNSKYGSEYFKPFKTTKEKSDTLANILRLYRDFEEVKGESKVDHPSHYNQFSIEPIDVIEDWQMNFNLGNVIKYISRAKYKGHELEDLKKAQWYLNREVSRHDKS